MCSKVIDDVNANFRINENETREEHRERITEENINLIHHVAKKFRNNPVAYDDLVSAGYLGFTKALNAFDIEKGVKFSTYAVNCIQNEILLFVKKEQKSSAFSLSFTISEDGDGNKLSLEDVIDSDTSCTEDEIPEDAMDRKEMEICIYDIVDELSPEEKYILVYRFGLYDQPTITQNEVAKNLGKSQASISKIEGNIVKKLHKKITKDAKLSDLFQSDGGS